MSGALAAIVAAGAGDQAARHLRQAEARGARGDDHPAGQRDLEAVRDRQSLMAAIHGVRGAA